MIAQTTLNRQSERASFLAHLSDLHPSLYSLVVDLMQIHGGQDCFTDRLLRAARLVIAGKVYQGHVKSQGSDKAYRVTFQTVYTCECEDYRRGSCHSDLGPTCKHTLAAHLAYLLGLELPRLDQNALPAWACNNRSIEDMLG